MADQGMLGSTSGKENNTLGLVDDIGLFDQGMLGSTSGYKPREGFVNRAIDTTAALGKGAYYGISADIPAMIGRGAQFIGGETGSDTLENMGKDVADWNEARAKIEPLEQASVLTYSVSRSKQCREWWTSLIQMQRLI